MKKRKGHGPIMRPLTPREEGIVREAEAYARTLRVLRVDDYVFSEGEFVREGGAKQ